MSTFRGGYIGPKRAVSGISASGIWSLHTQQQERGSNTWTGIPITVDYLLVGGGAAGNPQPANQTGGGRGGGGGGSTYATGVALGRGVAYSVTVAIGNDEWGATAGTTSISAAGDFSGASAAGGSGNTAGPGGGPGGHGGAPGGSGSGGSSYSITGSSVTYGGGGGGGSYSGQPGAPGGAGGGGNGSNDAGVAGTGQANRGGGGGGASGNPGSSRGGGSGVIIFRYLTSAATISIGAGLTGSTTTDGLYTVATITSGSGNVSW